MKTSTWPLHSHHGHFAVVTVILFMFVIFCWLFQGIIKLKPLIFSLLAAVSHFSRNIYRQNCSNIMVSMYVDTYQARWNMILWLHWFPPPRSAVHKYNSLLSDCWSTSAAVEENNCVIIRRGNSDLNHPTWGTKWDTYRQSAIHTQVSHHQYHHQLFKV